MDGGYNQNSIPKAAWANGYLCLIFFSPFILISLLASAIKKLSNFEPHCFLWKSLFWCYIAQKSRRKVKADLCNKHYYNLEVIKRHLWRLKLLKCTAFIALSSYLAKKLTQFDKNK